MTATRSPSIGHHGPMTRGLLCFVATAAVLLAGASAARATTVTYTPACPKSLCAPELTVTATTGERNNLVFSAGTGKRWLIEEATGVPLTGPTDVCTAITPSVLDCAAAQLQVDTGDENDTVTITDDTLGDANVRGGNGDDTLSSDAAATLDGGAGNDVVRGGRHDDRLVCSTGLDVLDGGGGQDALTFFDQSDTAGPVAVDLTVGTAARRGGISTLASIEDVSTFCGTASVIGTDAANRITMDRGIADGRGGNDRIQGNGILYGGDGDDTIIGTRSAGPTARCGPGRDIVTPLNGPSRMRLDPDCEALIPGTSGLAARGIAISPTPTVTSRQIRFRVACTASGGCSGSIAVPGLGDAAVADFKIARNKGKRISVPRPASSPIGQLVDETRRAAFTLQGRARGRNVRATWEARLLGAKDRKPLR